MTDRLVLPARRAAVTFELKFWKLPWRVTVGFYNDGTPGEVFITGGKSGVDVEATARDGAILISLALQYRVPLDVIVGALTKNTDGSPGSLVGAVAAKLVDMRHDLGVKP